MSDKGGNWKRLLPDAPPPSNAAQPMGVPLELRPIDAGYHYRREKEAVKLAKAREKLEALLPSDAAPVACPDCDKPAKFIKHRADLFTCEDQACDKWGSFFTGAHPEDAPSFLRACFFCGYTGVCSAHQRADPTCKTCFGERADD